MWLYVSGAATAKNVHSVYVDLWAFKKSDQSTDCHDESLSYQPLSNDSDDPVYDEVDTLIPSNLPLGTKIISNSEQGSTYNEVIINDGAFIKKLHF